MIKSTKLSWVVVSDIKKAKDFYVNKLGLILKEESTDYGWLELEPVDGSYRLGVAEFNPNHDAENKPGSNSILTFDVENIEKALEFYRQKGITFVGEVLEVPGHVKMIFFVDYDGNKFQLCEDLSSK